MKAIKGRAFSKIKPGVLIGIVIMLLLFALCFRVMDGFSSEIEAAIGGDTSEHARNVATGRALGLISLIAPALTIILAFVTKEVLLSLFAGLVAGAAILVSLNPSGSYLSNLSSVFSSVCDSVVVTVTDSFRVSVVILCFAIGGMVSVINASGGFAALGKKITRGINTPRKATLMSQIMGMCLFFDDYANSLITGPVMRDITDRQGVSREKLAYIVDSTAAPVAGVAIISSWIAAELSAIESGFEVAGVQASAYSLFLGSIPFCFYNFIAIAFVLVLTVTGREYGPMLKAERRARAGQPLKPSTKVSSKSDEEASMESGSIWSAFIPVLVLIVYAFAGFYINGMQNAVAEGAMTSQTKFSFLNLSTAFSYADTVSVLMRASILASITAMVMGCLTKKLTAIKAVGEWLKGASELLPTVLILVLAWSLAGIIEQLGTAYYLVDMVALGLPAWLLPMLVFLTCCLISFAAGSFGCMVIVMPIAVPIAYQAASLGGGQHIVLACVAAVLSGSIFGDHCSPVTDTTILSSMGAACDNIDHVKTQLPYALTVAALATVLGYLPAGLGVSPLISIPTGIIAATLIIRFVGKKVEPKAERNIKTTQ